MENNAEVFVSHELRSPVCGLWVHVPFYSLETQLGYKVVEKLLRRNQICLVCLELASSFALGGRGGKFQLSMCYCFLERNTLHTSKRISSGRIYVIYSHVRFIFTTTRLAMTCIASSGMMRSK